MALLVFRTAYLPPIEVDLSASEPGTQPNAIVRALRPQVQLFVGAGGGTPAFSYSPAGAPPEEWNPLPLLALAVVAVVGVWLLLR